MIRRAAAGTNFLDPRAVARPLARGYPGGGSSSPGAAALAGASPAAAGGSASARASAAALAGASYGSTVAGTPYFG